MKKHLETEKKEHDAKVAEAKKRGELIECVCCYNDECLFEDMLPCKGGHLFCRECVARASEVAIGEGKTSLTCLGQCEDFFEISSIQKALKPNMFSKWLRKIQLAEVEQAGFDALERCPFCEFASIMETTPEENKVFKCLNPECGKESCRLCKEVSHIPLRCEEVEKDSEVQKRTYIENKMTEALLRQCWKCQKHYLKSDGCNKMTCECGAQMCYLCRQPVKDYKHFYGQGAVATETAKCPLWSDNKKLHETEVAKGALDAKKKVDLENPDIVLKNDPTKGIKIPVENDNNNALHNQYDPFAAAGGLDHIIGGGRHRDVIVNHQRHIEEMIRQNRRRREHPRDLYNNPFPGPFINLPNPPPLPPPAHYPMVDQMGAILEMRQAYRDANRQIIRREQDLLERYRNEALANPNVVQQVPGPVLNAANNAPPAVPYRDPEAYLRAAGADRFIPHLRMAERQRRMDAALAGPGAAAGHDHLGMARPPQAAGPPQAHRHHHHPHQVIARQNGNANDVPPAHERPGRRGPIQVMVPNEGRLRLRNNRPPGGYVGNPPAAHQPNVNPPIPAPPPAHQAQPNPWHVEVQVGPVRRPARPAHHIFHNRNVPAAAAAAAPAAAAVAPAAPQAAAHVAAPPVAREAANRAVGHVAARNPFRAAPRRGAEAIWRPMPDAGLPAGVQEVAGGNVNPDPAAARPPDMLDTDPEDDVEDDDEDDASSEDEDMNEVIEAVDAVRAVREAEQAEELLANIDMLDELNQVLDDF